MHPQNRLAKFAQDARSAVSQANDTPAGAEIDLRAILSGFISPPMFRHRENPSSDTDPRPSPGSGGDSHAPSAFSTLLHIP
jgi:hypothetical protein